MKKYYFILSSILYFFLSNVCGQSQSINSRKNESDSLKQKSIAYNKKLPNLISLEITSLFIANFNLSYERLIISSTSTYTGINLGYKPHRDGHTFRNQDELDINGPISENMLMPFSKSLYGGFFIKQKIHGCWYVNVELFERQTQYDHVLIQWAEIDQSAISHGSAKTYSDSVRANINTIGFKLTGNYRKIIPISSKIAFVFDAYAGIGKRWQQADVFHYQTTLKRQEHSQPKETIATNKSETINNVTPSFQLGVKIGLSF